MRTGVNDIAEGDIELHRNSGFLEQSGELDSDTFVIRIFFDALAADTPRVEAEPVLLDVRDTDASNHVLEIRD
jgi:hypothetical protein